MAAESDLIRIQDEAVFIARKMLPQDTAPPFGATPPGFTPRHAAQLEKAFSDTLRQYIEKNNSFGITRQSINDFLLTDPDAAQKFIAGPFSYDLKIGAPPNEVPLTLEMAQEKGLVVPGPEGQPMIRNFMAIDETGRVIRTHPDGTPIKAKPDETPAIFNSVYRGLGKDDFMPDLVLQGIQKQVAERFELGGDFFKKLRGLDEILTLQTRLALMGEGATAEALGSREGNLAFYEKLLQQDEATRERILAEAIERANPAAEPPVLAPDASEDDKKAFAGKLAAHKTAEEQRVQQNRTLSLEYLTLLQSMQGLDKKGALNDVLHLNDMGRMKDVLLHGILGAGLTLAGGFKYDARWNTDPGLDKNRLWDRIGLGQIYEDLPNLADKGDSYYDLRVTAGYTIDYDGLKRVAGQAANPDPDFLKLLEEIDPGPDNKLDIREISKFSNVAYAYQVLKHEGRLTEGSLDRLANMFNGGAPTLNDEERRLVTNSINGIRNGDKAPLMLNPKWDAPLITYQLKAGEGDDESNAANRAQIQWFKDQLATGRDIPGLGVVNTTLSPEQGMNYFWMLRSRQAGFDGDLNRKIPDETLAAINAPAGTRYRDMDAAQTIAFFQKEYGIDVSGKIRDSYEEEALSVHINRRGIGEVQKDKYKVNMQEFIRDGMADGSITLPQQPAPQEDPAPAEPAVIPAIPGAR